MTPPDRDGAPTSLASHHLRLFALIVDYLLIITLLKLLDQLAMGADVQPALRTISVRSSCAVALGMGFTFSIAIRQPR